MKEAREGLQEIQAKQLILPKRLIGYGRNIAAGLRVAGLNVSFEPIQEKEDTLKLREKLKSVGKVKDLYPFQIKGAPYAVDIFSRSISEMEKWYDRIHQHKNVTRAAAALILAGVAYKIIRDVQQKRYPPRYDGRDFEE